MSTTGRKRIPVHKQKAILFFECYVERETFNVRLWYVRKVEKWKFRENLHN